MHFYGFRFADGTNTTTGGNHGTPLYIAGGLYRFASRAERDAWVSEGYNVCVPRDVGEFRRAVTTQTLPMGWKTGEAICMGEYAY
ncbi:MAG: hypothetical protein ACTSX8_03175 [Alphaproteobacteria bacterium]